MLLSGPIYGARDAAHARLFDLMRAGRAAELPLDLRDGAVYYVGPAPAPEGPQAHVVGSAGPTTSTRMDAYTPLLIEHGLRLMVGKGRRGPEVKAAMVRYGAVYLAATGAPAALLARQIVASRVVAYADLGPEAIHLHAVSGLPRHRRRRRHRGRPVRAGPGPLRPPGHPLRPPLRLPPRPRRRPLRGAPHDQANSTLIQPPLPAAIMRYSPCASPGGATWLSRGSTRSCPLAIRR